MTTFITFIGKGKKNGENRFAYEDVNYRFGQKEIPASCFANAVLNSKDFDIARVCVIGTYSSSWAQLLESPAPEEESLFLDLCDDNVLPEKLLVLLPQLESALQKHWQVEKVELIPHPAELNGHEEEILGQYFSLMQAVEGNVVLDVTHSFRWMPQFLTSAMQLADAFDSRRNILILYGELSPEDKKSCPVRVLDTLWDARKLAADIRLFFEKWEAEPLAKRLESSWMSGAKSLRKLGRYLQGNYLLPLMLDKAGGGIGVPWKQLRNALNDIAEEKNLPPWLQQVREKLNHLCQAFESQKNCAARLWKLAEMYADRKMYGQALLCQECTLRMYIWRWSRNPGYPDWTALTAVVKAYEKSQKKSKNLPEQYWHILRNRNAVAHGALASAGESGGVPNPENLPSQYQSQQEYLKRLMELP